MQANTIDLGDGLNAFEFLLNPQDQTGPATAQRQDQRKNNLPELERLADLYYNEKLVTIDGVKYPFVYVADSNLDGILMDASAPAYEVPGIFRKFTQAIMDSRKDSFEDRPHMRVADWYIDMNPEVRHNIALVVGPVGYGEFIATNKSMDVLLAKYDPSFREGETLRDYDIVNGIAKDPDESSMSNMLGLGFVVTARGQDGKSYFLFGRRGKNLAVECGTISMFGGTPEWGDEHIKKNIVEEMEEELLLKPDEFIIHMCYLAKDFTRAPDIFPHVRVTGLIVEDIARRCYGDKGVMEEHDRIYAVPVKPEAIRRIVEGRAGFDLNIPTIVAAHLYHCRK